MKKIFMAAFALMLGATAANAQTPVHPRIEAALNFANMTNSSEGISASAKVALGARVGALAEVGLGNSLYIAPGLMWKMAGTSVGDSDDNMRLTLHYLNVPINMGYRWELNPVALSVELGPYFSYGLTGKASVNSSLDPVDLDRDNELFKKGGFNRFDLGVGASVAAEYDKVQLRLGLEYGFWI